MAQLPLIAGPLSAAAAPFAAEEARAPDPAALLADLVDARGSVELANALVELEAELPSTAADPELLRQRLDTGIKHVEWRMQEALNDPWRPRYRLPTPRRAHALLERAGALEARKGAPLKTGARTFWAPFGDFLDTHLKRARFALRDLRGELAAELRGQGADAARLERLDAALTLATSSEVEKLYRRVAQACEADFVRLLRSALTQVDGPITTEVMEPWFAPDGWLHALMARSCRLVEAIFAHERRHLEALVESCCSAGLRPR